MFKRQILKLVTLLIAIASIALGFQLRQAYYAELDYLSLLNDSNYFQISSRPKDRFSQSEFVLDIKKKAPKFKDKLREYFLPFRLLAKTSSYKALECGDVLTIKQPISIKPLSGFKKKIYLKEKVFYELKTKSLEFKTHKSSAVYKLQKKIKYFYLSKLGIYNGSIVNTLLLGTRVSELPRDFAQKVRNLGLGHFFAASGFHLLVLSLFLLWFLKFTALPTPFMNMTVLVAVWIYSALAGFSPSVIRAAILISAYFIFSLLGRQSRSLNILFSIAFIALILDPYVFFDIGFQFSYLATLAILLFASKIKAYAFSFLPLSWKLYLENNSQVKLNAVKKFFLSVFGHFLDIFCVSFSVQLLLTPLIICYFKSLHIWTLPANLLFSPLLSLLVVFSFIGVYFLIKPLLLVFKFLLFSFQSLPLIKIQLSIISLITSLGLSFVAYKKLDIYSGGLNSLVIKDRSKLKALPKLRKVDLLILPNLNSKDIYFDTLLKITEPKAVIVTYKKSSKRLRENLRVIRKNSRLFLNPESIYLSKKHYYIK